MNQSFVPFSKRVFSLWIDYVVMRLMRVNPALNCFLKHTRSHVFSLSLNIRGLRNSTKRKANFLFCKEQRRITIFFVQETHSVDNNFNKWGCGDIFLSHGTSHSAGVAILLRQFDGKVIVHKNDIEGHRLMAIVEHSDSYYVLVNI